MKLILDPMDEYFIPRDTRRGTSVSTNVLVHTIRKLFPGRNFSYTDTDIWTWG